MKVSEHELNAYVDGQVEPGRRAVIEAYLAAHPEESQRIAAYAGQRRGLHALYDHWLADALPEPMQRLGVQLERGRIWSRRRRQAMRMAAAVALVALGAGGFMLHHALVNRPQTRALWAAIVDMMGGIERLPPGATASPGVPVALPPGGNDAAAVRLPAAPDLSPFGYALAVTRILDGEPDGAAQFVYVDRRGAQVVMYVAPTAQRNQSVSVLQEGRVSALSLNVGGRSVLVVGEMDRERLLRLAGIVMESWVTGDRPAAPKAPDPSKGRGAAAPSTPPQPAPAPEPRPDGKTPRQS